MSYTPIDKKCSKCGNGLMKNKQIAHVIVCAGCKQPEQNCDCK